MTLRKASPPPGRRFPQESHDEPDGCVRRQLSAGKEGRRQRLVRSGFAAALVDVVLHQGDDLLQLVVQLGATRRGVGLQSAHHLKGKVIKIKKQHTQEKKKKKNVTFGGLVHSPAEVGHLPGRGELELGGRRQQQLLLLRPFDTLPSTPQKPLFAYLQKKPHICAVIHAQ